ncbi:MAG: ribonuclease P protein component [Flavobacteriaceae bacterium]|nr:ribonuclease P protein component [Flavobacteriaceae bacterium]MDZ4147095.1 ribonuclease P protein component [Flavobacteriaceae bacterium]
MNQKFPKSEKLKSTKTIERLFKEGLVLTAYPFKAVCIPDTFEVNNFPVKAGVSVSKRNFKKAVDRNRIKRLMREAYRRNKYLIFNKISTHHAIMFLYLGREIPSLDKTDRHIIVLINKFLKDLEDRKDKNISG